jgi:RHS repeat-associated protein
LPGFVFFDVSYNLLNLPKAISKSTDNISYIYSAAGEKLAKKLKDNTYQYYAGSMVYNNDKTLNYLLTDEGRVIKAGSSFTYEYHLKDHLGNTRVSFQPNGTSTTILQAADYYPFGSSFVPTSPNNDNKYLYNGKEKQDDVLGGTALDWYDYGARFYDAQIGRTSQQDPHAENYYDVSPYSFLGNNPILYIDPTGEDLYLYYYLSNNNHGGEEDEESDKAFWAAALTRAADMLKSGEIGEGDKVIFKGISSTDDIKSTIEGDVAANKEKFGETREVGLWSHGGFEGPFRENKNGSIDQKPVESWSGINYNWVKDGGKFGFYGCRTGKDPDDREGGRRDGQSDKSFAERISSFNNMKNVDVWGQTQRSWPSPVTNARYVTGDIAKGIHKYPTYFVGSQKGGTGVLSRALPTAAYPMAVYKNGQFVGFKFQPGQKL